MFGKKKQIDPRVFIPKATRIVVIIQLCLVFSLASWVAIQPQMQRYFHRQSLIGLYKTVMGEEDLLVKARPEQAPALAEKLQRNRERYETLPEAQRYQLEAGRTQIQQSTADSWATSVRRMWVLLARELNPFAQGWLFFSTLVCILLLCRIEGAQLAAWILPLMVILYGVDKHYHHQPSVPPADAQLYPTEQVILRDYLKEPLSDDILEQRDQLLKGWRLYLVRHWADETPSASEPEFERQIERGEFAFNLARIDAFQSDSADRSVQKLKGPVHPLLLLLYLIWNLFFAYFVNRKRAID